jgi:replication-associated recombination protein RarA
MPLWKQIRPKSLDDFVGNDFELAALEGFDSGGVIFTGPYGCGKTSAACALASRIFGAPVVITEEYQQWYRHEGQIATFVHYVNLDLHKVTAAGFRQYVLGFAGVCGRRIFILDEAHRLSAKLQGELKASIERQYQGSSYLLCTAFQDKLVEPLRQVCQIVQLEPLSEMESSEMIVRAWAAAAPDKPIPAALIAAVSRYHIAAPRVIVDVVEDVAAGIPALEAARKHAH